MQGVSDLATVRQRGRGPQSALELRGLLHDLGHGLATLSYLTDGIREDPALSNGTQRRLDLVEQELGRLLELVQVRVCDPAPELFEARDLLHQLVAVTAASTGVSVTLRPGEEVTMHTDPMLLWRMVANLVDNAVRAVGDDGDVVVAVSAVADAEAIIEVTDDGPGLGNVPDGLASLGIGIVSGLAQRCGARLDFGSVQPRGTRAQLVFSDRQVRGA